jgi:peroxiredoxin
MAFLVAAVVVVGVLGLVNLLFAFGVIRRLREHTELLDKLGNRPAGGDPGPVMLEPGETVADFEATTVEGDRVTRDDLSGSTLVAVFSPGCSACEAQMGKFVEYAAAHPGGRDKTLAVVVGPEAESASYVERLEATARVVREDREGSVSKALGVRGFPSFALVDGNVVRASGFEVAVLSAAVAG